MSWGKSKEPLGRDLQVQSSLIKNTAGVWWTIKMKKSIYGHIQDDSGF